MPFFKLNDVFAGRYQLRELLGEGNSGEVWKATDQMADDAVVVLKIYAPENGLDDEGVRHFKQKFTLSQHLSHPHLLKAYHFDVWDGSPYLIMPFSPLGSLSRLLEEKGTITERQLALLLSQIGSVLAELHRQEPPVLHQDVKPDNIVLSQPDYFLLADFEVSTRERPALPPSHGSTKPVTRAYAAPESFDPSQRTDASSDIFSLGVTLFEMCTKTIPWHGAGGQSLLKGGGVPNLPEHFSPELNELLRACMSANKALRPDADELHRRGEHFLETGSWNLLDKKEEGKPARKLMLYLLAAAGFALFMVSIYWGYQNDHLAMPVEKPQKADPFAAENQDIDQMLIATLEEELESMAKRTQALEEENEKLKSNGQENSILVRKQDSLVEKSRHEPENKTEVEVIPNEKTPKVLPKVATQPKEEVTPALKEGIEEQLNKISNPEISGKTRTAWKQETMAQFAEGPVQIVDETEGTPKRYSAGIFLNLLYNVPHTIEVKEVKTNQERKVTELRLTMQTKM